MIVLSLVNLLQVIGTTAFITASVIAALIINYKDVPQH